MNILSEIAILLTELQNGVKAFERIRVSTHGITGYVEIIDNRDGEFLLLEPLSTYGGLVVLNGVYHEYIAPHCDDPVQNVIWERLIRIKRP